MRNTVFLLSILLAAGPAEHAMAEAGESWFEGQSDHFRVFTNLEKDEAVELVRNLERFRATLGELTGLGFEEDYSPPLTVFAYAKEDEYVDRYDMRGTSGFYMNRAEGAVSALSMEEGSEAWEPQGIETLFHEYTHHLLHQYSPVEYPVWYDEGFAEFVSTMKFDGDRVTVGEPPIQRFFTLRNSGDWLPFETIMEAKGNYILWAGPRVMRNPDRNKSGILQQYA